MEVVSYCLTFGSLRCSCSMSLLALKFSLMMFLLLRMSINMGLVTDAFFCTASSVIPSFSQETNLPNKTTVIETTTVLGEGCPDVSMSNAVDSDAQNDDGTHVKFNKDSFDQTDRSKFGVSVSETTERDEDDTSLLPAPSTTLFFWHNFLNFLRLPFSHI